MPKMQNNARERTIFATIVGLPNVGKSTLLNRLLGVKIAIISPKAQTTRNRIMGVLTEGDVQYVFADTPGVHSPKTRLGQHMEKSIREAISGVDCALFVTWAKDAPNEQETAILEELRQNKTPVVLVLNKCDTLADPQKAQESVFSLGEQYRFADAVCVSATTGQGIDELKSVLKGLSHEGPHLFPPDTLTDMPEKTIVSELIREKLLLNLRDELPHGCAVSVEQFKEREGKNQVDIDAEIVCEKESHKGMVIGKDGLMLKKIGGEARHDIEEFLGCRVHLKLFVKVREGWRDKEQMLRNFGY